MKNEIVPTNETAVSSWSPSNFNDAMKLSEIVASTGFAPNAYKNKPQDCLMAMMAGNEVGLGPMASLQNIAVINGCPSIFGDAALALVKAASDYEYLIESFDEGTMTAVCRAKRRNEPEENMRRFSKRDAETAKLWNKPGPWTQYPKRMLQMRARSLAIRDTWPHILKGLSIKEESQDIPRDVTPVEPVQSMEDTTPIIDERRVQIDRLIGLLDVAIEEGKATMEESDSVKNTADSFQQLDILVKFVNKVEKKLNEKELNDEPN